MSTCKQLAERYATEENKPIPPRTASFEEKQAWLYTAKWGCIPPGESAFVEGLDACKEVNDRPAPTAGSSNLASRPPVLNKLQESGFLHWVNQRGYQCINRLTGTFYGLDEKTGLAKVPGPDQSNVDSKCWGACYQATSASDMCVECVVQQLTDDSSLCPQIDVSDSKNDFLIKEAIACHECIGTQNRFEQKAGSPAGTADLEKMQDRVWDCLTGSVRAPLSTADLVLIIVGAVFVATVAVTLGVYFGVIRPRAKRHMAEQEVLRQKGIDPDSL